MDSAQMNELRERLTAFKEGRLPEEVGGDRCTRILYKMPEEAAIIAKKLVQSVTHGHRRGGIRPVLFRSEDLPLLP